MIRAYEFEREAFPWHWTVRLRPEYRTRLATVMCERFGLGPVPAMATTNGRGLACHHHGLGYDRFSIRLPRPSAECHLGLVCHEVAHIVNVKVFGGRIQDHTGTFKKALIKVFVECRLWLPRVLAQIKAEVDREVVRSAALTARSERKAERLQEARRRRQEPASRLRRAQERVGRLRTKAKRLATALRKAERSLRALEKRYGAQTGTHQIPPPVAPPL